jgi:hypothetical protein
MYRQFLQKVKYRLLALMPSLARVPSFSILAFIILCTAGISAFVYYFVLGVPEVTYSDGIVSGGRIRRPLNVVFAHLSEEYFIRVGGRTYRRVRGLPPFYLTLPQLKSILFVTDVGDDGAGFHIVRTSDWATVTIQGEKLSFGSNIGMQSPPGSSYTDFVEKEDSGELVLATKYPQARSLLFIDLEKKKIAKVVYDKFDDMGRTNSRSVYVDGRLVR